MTFEINIRILYLLKGDSERRKKFRLNKYNAVIQNIENKTAKMLQVYNAKNEKTGEKRCGYFDATVTNGGPQAFQPVRFGFFGSLKFSKFSKFFEVG